MTTLRTLLMTDRPDAPQPHLDRVTPPAAMPGGEVEVHGVHLDPNGARIPHATLGDTAAPIILSRPTRATIQIPEGSITGDLILHRNGRASNPLNLRVAVPMAENLHPVANPAVDADGNVYATVSGSRGQTVPVSIFQIQRDFQIRPFARELLNATGLAFDADGYLYTSSRAEGTVYRISPEGAISTYAEGMGIATGIAFDRDGNLYVGDRSGTIFKIGRGDTRGSSGEIFVYATLEPSMAAYHLAFNDAGTLFVTGPTTSSNQAIHAIDRDGNTTVFYQGLGRAQGMAFDVDDNLYVAASLHGQSGIVRIDPHHQASLAISGHLRPQPRRSHLPRRWLCRSRHPRCALPRSPRHRRPQALLRASMIASEGDRDDDPVLFCFFALCADRSPSAYNIQRSSRPKPLSLPKSPILPGELRHHKDT